MSNFKTMITTVLETYPHPNAHSLDICKVYGWEVVVQKDKWKQGDKCIYIQIDTILPKEIENKLFPSNSKITLNNSRVRQIKIRNFYSQGMIINPSEFNLQNISIETDVSDILNTKKYEPPVASLPSHMHVKTSKKIQNPTFNKYTHIENIKYYDRTLENYEEVVATCKLHGTSARYSWEPYPINTAWRKVLKFFGLAPKWEFCWGSHNVQIQNKLYHKGYYEEDVYTKMIKQYNLKEVIPKGCGIYGEIVGSGIQDGYSYGCAQGEHKFFVYDVRSTNKWWDYDAAKSLTKIMKLDYVSEMYRGPFVKETITQFLNDNPISKEVNEGLVVKPTKESYSNVLGRVILKYINPKYLENKDLTEFH